MESFTVFYVVKFDVLLFDKSRFDSVDPFICAYSIHNVLVISQKFKLHCQFDAMRLNSLVIFGWHAMFERAVSNLDD